MSSLETPEDGSNNVLSPALRVFVGVSLLFAAGCGAGDSTAAPEPGVVRAAESEFERTGDPGGDAGSAGEAPGGASSEHGDGEPEAVSEGPREIPDPERPIVLLGPSEVLTVAVQDWLHGLAEKIAIRDLGGAAEWFAPAFTGPDLFGAVPVAEHDLPLDAVRHEYHPASLAPVDRTAFLAGLERRVGDWRRVLQSEWKVTGAEFEDEEPVRWGKVHLHVLLTGLTESGGRFLLEAELAARVENGAQGWSLARIVVEHLTSSQKHDTLFVDVSRSSGVAHEGIRYGQPGNDSDAWNGVAAGDIDGDERLDVFVPSSERNFLYRNRADGTFEELASELGVAHPGGGTGAVFFDVDNDGDQDLVVAHVGAVGQGRETVGNTAHLYRNDGRGHFADAGEGVGLDQPHVSYSLTALDYDLDGYVDLFFSGYGRMDVARNNSWIEATNGSPNRLLRNVEGRHFVDVTTQAGLDDWRWSYQAAAADYDRDGDQDLYVANNFGSNRLYRNEGDGTFRDVAAELGVAERGNTMAVCWGDMNSDGRLDLFVAGPTSVAGQRVVKRLRGSAHDDALDDLLKLASGNALFLGREGGRFERSASGYGAAHAGWVWSSAAGDLDLDGALDLFCVNGFVTGDLPQDT